MPLINRGELELSRAFKMECSGRAPHRDFKASTKANSDFKWKADRSVVGALEVVTDPGLDLRAKMTVHQIVGHEDEFLEFYRIWEDLKLRKKIINAFESIAPETTCCGMVTNEDKTIKHNAHILNKGWVKSTNEKILETKGFRISIYVWRWSNISGKAETVVPMIRFHSLALFDETTPKSNKTELMN